MILMEIGKPINCIKMVRKLCVFMIKEVVKENLANALFVLNKPIITVKMSLFQYVHLSVKIN